MAWRVWLFVFFAGLVLAPASCLTTGNGNAINLSTTIALSGVSDPNNITAFDHMDIDVATGRLFLAVKQNNSIAIISTVTNTVIDTIPNVPLPQGVAVVTQGMLRNLVVAAATSVYCFSLFPPYTSLWNTALNQPDNVRFDAVNNLVFVATYGAMAALDPATGVVVGNIVMPPVMLESFVLSPVSNLLYLAAGSSLTVVDRGQLSVVATWPVAGSLLTAVAFDNATNRVVALDASTATPRMVVLNAADGALVASMPVAAGCDDVFFDSKSRLIFLTCAGAPGVSCSTTYVVQQLDANTYALQGTLPAPACYYMARTCFWAAALSTLFVGVPRGAAGPQSPQVLVYTLTPPPPPVPSRAVAATLAPLPQLVADISLPNAWDQIGQPKFDHFDIDLASGRLFLAAKQNNSIAIMSTVLYTWIDSIPNVPQPQGVVAVTSNGLWSLLVTSADSLWSYSIFPPYTLQWNVTLGTPDNLRYDATNNLVFVSLTGSIAVVNPQTGVLVNTISVPINAQVEELELSTASNLLFASVNDSVVVVHRGTQSIVATWNYPNSLLYANAYGAASNRLFVVDRSAVQMPRVLVINAADGRVVWTAPTATGCDGVYFDAASGVGYVTCAGTPGVSCSTTHVVRQLDANTYAMLAPLNSFACLQMARTSLWVPSMSTLFVGVPLIASAMQSASVLVFSAPTMWALPSSASSPTPASQPPQVCSCNCPAATCNCPGTDTSGLVSWFWLLVVGVVCGAAGFFIKQIYEKQSGSNATVPVAGDEPHFYAESQPFVDNSATSTTTSPYEPVPEKQNNL